MIPCLEDILKIIASLINCFSPPAIVNKEADAIWGDAMLDLIDKQNTLKTRIEREHLDTKRNWVDIDAAVCLLPTMTEEQLRDITFGQFPYIASVVTFSVL
jgi:hypothetical protein